MGVNKQRLIARTVVRCCGGAARRNSLVASLNNRHLSSGLGASSTTSGGSEAARNRKKCFSSSSTTIDDFVGATTTSRTTTTTNNAGSASSARSRGTASFGSDRASTSGRVGVLRTMKKNGRMFASDASILPSKNAAASSTSTKAEEEEEEEEEEEVEEDIEDDDEGMRREEEDKASVPEFRGNKAGRLSTQAISRHPGGGGGGGGGGKRGQDERNRKKSGYYKPATTRAQIDGMNCEQLLEEIKQRFESRKKPFLGGGNVPSATATGTTKSTKTSSTPRNELEESTVEIESFKHEISERLASFLGFGEGERGVKATRRFVERRLKSYCEEMNLFVGERDESGKRVKRMKDPENPGKWEERRFLLDTKLKRLFQTPDGVDQLAFRKRTKADESGDFVDGVAPVSVFLDPHFVDITDQDASRLVQSKVHGSKVIVKKNNRVYAVRESALKILLQRVRSPKDVQYALEAVALFHMERAAMGKTRGVGFERAYEFIKACCDVKSYETALWACEQSRSLGLNLSRKTLLLLLWHLLDANRPLEEVLRVYSVIRNLKLGVDAKTAQFVVKSALQHGHVNAAAGYCVQFMQAGVKVNRKTPTAIMNAAIEHNLPNAAIVVERSWNKEQPQLPKAPFDRLALAQAYALLDADDECTNAAKSIVDTLDGSFSDELKSTTSSKLALWPQKILANANEAKGGASAEILERCKRGMVLIKSACDGKLFDDVDVEYAFSMLQIDDNVDDEQEQTGEEEMAVAGGEDEKKEG